MSMDDTSQVLMAKKIIADRDATIAQLRAALENLADSIDIKAKRAGRNTLTDLATARRLLAALAKAGGQ